MFNDISRRSFATDPYLGHKDNDGEGKNVIVVKSIGSSAWQLAACKKTVTARPGHSPFMAIFLRPYCTAYGPSPYSLLLQVPCPADPASWTEVPEPFLSALA